MTQWLSSNTHPSVYTKEHWLVDQIFKRTPTVNVTFINPGLFASAYFLNPEPIIQFGMMLDFGPNAPPSNEDIGAVAAYILKDSAPHAGQIYRITGRDLLTSTEMANVMGKVLGRKVRVQKMPEKMMLKALRAGRFPIMDSSQLRYYVRDAQSGGFALNAPTNVVQEIVGREADDFETITRRYLEGKSVVAQTFGNKMRAMINMMKVGFTPAWNMEKFEQEQGFPQFKHMRLSAESEEWRQAHGVKKTSQPELELRA
ncbi:MAG: hypothetical protein ACE5FD_01460 [Anaerolineae bacterium]